MALIIYTSTHPSENYYFFDKKICFFGIGGFVFIIGKVIQFWLRSFWDHTELDFFWMEKGEDIVLKPDSL